MSYPEDSDSALRSPARSSANLRFFLQMNQQATWIAPQEKISWRFLQNCTKRETRSFLSHMIRKLLRMQSVSSGCAMARLNQISVKTETNENLRNFSCRFHIVSRE